MNIKERLTPLFYGLGHELGMGANRLIMLTPSGDDVQACVQESIVRAARLTGTFRITLAVYGIKLLCQDLLKLYKIRFPPSDECRLEWSDCSPLVSAIKGREID